MTDSRDLADGCVEFVVRHVEALANAHLPDMRLPRVFAGHAVGADVRADLAFTLGLLLEYGVTAVAGRDIRDCLDTVLAEVDGRRTNTFFSYRIAETLMRLDAVRPLPDHLVEACDSTDAVEGLDRGTLPRNYAAVLARCEVARARLGLIAEDDAQLLDLIERTRQMLSANQRGFLDDSRTGAGRYDIYSADVYLFTEPFAGRLGEAWRRGAAAAVDLVERVGAANGAAFSWGRSTGALGIALTIELAGLVARYGVGGEPSTWTALGANALARLGGWFSPADGVIRAHQHRSTFSYRGPHRRLQMTLDVLGKLVDAGLALRSGDRAEGAVWVECHPPRNELVLLDPDRHAAVWAYRAHDLAFTLPLVGTTGSDYLPAPRNPGLLETPVDSGLVAALPFAIRSGRTYAPAGLPSEVALESRGLVTTHDNFLLTGQLEVPPDTPRLEGARRSARYAVEGRTLTVEEDVTFAGTLPHALAVQVPEADGRPLRVEAQSGDASITTTVIDTSGIKEWRSFWGELPVVHQIEVEPARHVRFRWSVTPKLRVLATAHEHHYHRALYDPLAEDVIDQRFPTGRINDPAALRATLDRCDIFHLHWPEWLFGADVARHRILITALRERGVGIVWTQHNLAPHVRDERMDAVYRAWAAAADAALHHSEWGQRQVRARYPFREEAVHAVVPHPHFGHLARREADDRAAVETELGLRAGVTRLGIIGAPRPGKDVELVLRAFARCSREDLELVVFSLEPGDEVPDDPRVRAVPYEMVPRARYEQRLSAIDVLVLPFTADRMLTTGTVGDAVAHGIPALASSWPFLAEVLGDAAVVYGTTEDDLVAALDRLDPDELARAAAASTALQPRYAAGTVARALLSVLERVGTTRL